MNTILITVDALRADHLGQYGYDRDTMPSLDRIADNGTIFEKTFSNGPYTRTSVPSIHTSTRIGYQDIENRRTIAGTLSENGIHTGVVGTHTGYQSVKHGLGFDEFLDLGESAYRESEPPPLVKLREKSGDVLRLVPPLHRLAKKGYEAVTDEGFSFNTYNSAEAVTDEAIEWIADNTSSDFFLWLHYMEAHRPYGLHDNDPAYAPSISRERNKEMWETAIRSPDELSIAGYNLLIDQYDSNLRYCSRHLDRLFDTLEHQNIFDTTNIVFTSDHGEEFYEHGRFTHHNLPYDELIHVPLIVRGENTPEQKVSEQRELLDLGPTITDFHGIESPESFEGQNLFEGDPRRMISLGSHVSDTQVIGCRWDGWKYIWTEESEQLYDLAADPREEHNIVRHRPEARDHLRESIPRELFETEPEELRDPEDEVDRKRLKALGYIQE